MDKSFHERSLNYAFVLQRLHSHPTCPEVHNHSEDAIATYNPLNPHHPTITTDYPTITTSSFRPFPTTPPSPQTSSISLKVYSTK